MQYYFGYCAVRLAALRKLGPANKHRLDLDQAFIWPGSAGLLLAIAHGSSRVRWCRSMPRSPSLSKLMTSLWQGSG